MSYTFLFSNIIVRRVSGYSPTNRGGAFISSTIRTDSRLRNRSDATRFRSWSRTSPYQPGSNGGNSVPDKDKEERIRRSLESFDQGNEDSSPAKPHNEYEEDRGYEPQIPRGGSSREWNRGDERSFDRKRAAASYSGGRGRSRENPYHSYDRPRAIRFDDGRIRPQDDGYDGDHIFGVMPVKAALQGGKRRVKELLVQEGMDLSNKKDESSARELLELARAQNVTLREFPKHDLNMLVDNKPHQGFVLRARPLNLEMIDSLSSTETFKCVLALDEVVDPQNVGALIRSSHFLGCDKVVICSKNSAPLSPTVCKASSGALEFVDISETKNMMRFLDKSKENGWQVVGAALEDSSIDLKDLDVSKPTILVLGNEGHGVRTNILKRCDALVKIRGRGVRADASVVSSNDGAMVDSLNVSVSGAILLHYILCNGRY